MKSSIPLRIIAIITESNNDFSDQLNEEEKDRLDSKLKTTLYVIAWIILVLVIFFALLYYCRQCIKIGRDASLETPHPSERRPSALVMIFNNENDITGYWDTEVNVENDCASVDIPEPVRVEIVKTEAFVELNNPPPTFKTEAAETIPGDTPTSTEQTR